MTNDLVKKLNLSKENKTNFWVNRNNAVKQ